MTLLFLLAWVEFVRYMVTRTSGFVIKYANAPLSSIHAAKYRFYMHSKLKGSIESHSSSNDFTRKDEKNTSKSSAIKPHSSSWELQSQFVSIQSPWMSLIGERYIDDQNQMLDYWRIEKDHSIVIATLYKDQFLLPKPMYRPGVNHVTLDFAGGRVPPLSNPTKKGGDFLSLEQVASLILQRELGIDASKDIESLVSLNRTPQQNKSNERDGGWLVNSSISNQKLFGFVAQIRDTADLHIGKGLVTYPDTEKGIQELLCDLNCLQCRHVLLEYLFRRAQSNHTC